jgi:hypothetical protein
VEDRTKGAWLLSHSQKLDQATGVERLENIHFSGTVGRLHNILRRETEGRSSIDINPETVRNLCQLNGIDLPSRREGLRVLREIGQVDLGADGTVEVLGATTRTVLETAAAIFSSATPSAEEEAILTASDRISSRPQERHVIAEALGDEHHLSAAAVDNLLNVASDAALLDQENYKDKVILFSQNVFRDSGRAKKVYFLLESLGSGDAAKVVEAQALLQGKGAVYEREIVSVLGEELYARLLSVAFFDRMEVNNTTEAVGYVASPDTFQRYGTPFEEDPVDDAKALIASFTYGMVRSYHARGKIVLPELLIRKLVNGGVVGDTWPVRAIGEDYREVEKRGVVQVIPAGHDRFRMKLLKKDVGELALAIIKGQSPAEESLLMRPKVATSFRGPEDLRTEVRSKNTITDRRFVTEALDALRSGE